MTPRGDALRMPQRPFLAPLILAGLALCGVTLVLSGMGADDLAAGRDEFVLLPAGRAAPAGVGPTAAPTGAPSAAGRYFAQGLAVVPRVAGVAGAGFVISRQSDPAMLAGHKLRVGDVLLAMDGKPLDPVRLQSLGDELAAFDSVEVSYERDGQVRNRLLTFD